MDHLQQPESFEARIAELDLALRSGVLADIARAAAPDMHDPSATEVGNVLLPPKGDSPLPARWMLVADAPKVIADTAKERSEDIQRLAERLGMRQSESLIDANIAAIDSTKAVWVVEGGANRTSVVRRNLAEEAMQRVFSAEDEDVDSQTIYQLGSGSRTIPRQLKDGRPNAEYAVAQEIAGDFLPPDDSLTEFGLNLASALQSGYTVTQELSNTPGALRVVQMQRPGSPRLVLIQPETPTLAGGMSAVSGLTECSQQQFVIATNGQYRPKDELEAKRWSENNSMDMLPAVVLGDEPGYTVDHNGQTITTAARGPVVYLNEMIVLFRQSGQI